jgi:hypothetical protein
MYTPAGGGPVERTQIYLTSDQKARIEAIAKARSVPMALVIRDAVSHYLAASDPGERSRVLQQTFESVPEWKEQDGLKLARDLRSQWSRPASGSARGEGKPT